ncbi:hypothetical protein [Thalassotalea agarivorans]|uniref:Uncharacterized protein n=1 Tax=Thalassotalea agarivorans TaxID=349064 RepID=A0A1I0EWE1_THASX|nr:hypothetical protein [Thalassotalea agarivorans]SET49973.1 hypothetical protein SAMN05660429_01973 [Thalassotalea agarivorans]
MNKDTKRALDDLMLDEKYRNVPGWIFVGLILLVIGYVSLGSIGTDSQKVVGEVISTHTRMHDEGHTLYIMVKIPNRTSLVKVKLPTNQPIKKDAKVELNQVETLWLEKHRYTFSKYLDSKNKTLTETNKN